MSFTVVSSKASKDYVDTQDLETREEIKTTMSAHEKIHNEANASQDARYLQIQNDLAIIKEYLINKKNK
jgi:hypothetical protein